MAKPYSQDLRDRVIGAVDSGISARAASRLFGISESTGIKWGARWLRTGSIGSHKGVETRRRIEACGARLLFLPPYSPDLKTPSRWPSPSLRPDPERRANAPSTNYGTASAAYSKPSHNKNAQTTSGMPDMCKSKLRML